MSKAKALSHLYTQLNHAIQPFELQGDYEALFASIGDAEIVLMGEATHGTQEFYQARADISKQLIEQKGFMAIAIEGDWPDVYPINRYLRGQSDVAQVETALQEFRRFPQWMWRNETMVNFLKQLRSYNDQQKSNEKIGVYGLDLYSLYRSIDAVIQYLSSVDLDASARAKARYACFDHMETDAQSYGYLTSMGIKADCTKEVIAQLIELQQQAFAYIQKDGEAAYDEYFYALQNARLIQNAEHYYRSMFAGHITSWNVRDTHMADTVDVLRDHLQKRYGTRAKIIIWAHNSHVGDARATEMGTQGEINIGQLLRERHPNNTFHIGFSTYEGTVMAASDWGGEAMRKKVLPGLASSYEELFHHLQYKNFLLDFRAHPELEHYLHLQRLQRAIGVIYRPETERQSHYFFTHLPAQFDCLIHFDETHAVEPLPMLTPIEE